MRDLEAQLIGTRRVLTAFCDIASALAAPADADRLLGLALDRASALLDADRATLYLIDDATGELVSKLVVGGGEQTIRLAVGQGIAGAVVQTGKPIRVADAYTDDRFNRSWDGKTGYRTRSILAVPMKNHVGQTIGVLQVLNKREGKPFTDEDENLLGVLAMQAAISIDNVKLYLAVVEKNNVLAQVRHTLERKVDFLNLLFELESTMSRATDQRSLVQPLLGLTVAATRTQAGAVFLLDQGGTQHNLFVFKREAPNTVTEYLVDHVMGAFLQAIQQKGPVSIEQVRRRSKATAEQSLMGLHARSVLAVPMLSEEGDAFGALVLYDREDEAPFTEDDQELLRLVAANASTAISLLRSRESQRVSDRLSTIGRLLSNVLHDLKTPMAVISGYVQLMATTESAEQRKSYSELVLKQFDHITAMQREVLAFARGERTLLVSKVYLQKFFDELRLQMEKELEGRGIELQMELRDRGTARFDQAKVMRALHNLARNALDAMTAGGLLRIEIDRDTEGLVLRVSDTGPGIPEQIRGKLFRSFVTADKANGTGLGLAIVKKIAEEHGGKIDVTSSPTGSTFTLHIPQTG